jgi:hypothetical protein
LKNSPEKFIYFEGDPAWTMRTFLQRYGTEAHRDIFGQDFWLDQTLPKDSEGRLDDYYDDPNRLIVVTDCRFPNEAQRVKDCGGVVAEVVGPAGPMDPNAEHPSERALPSHLCNWLIWNQARDDNYEALDRELRVLLAAYKIREGVM